MNQERIINWSLLLGLGIIWGFSFKLMDIGLKVFDAYQVGALRISLAFIAMLPIILVKGLKVPKKKVPLVILSSLLGSGIPPFLFTMAQTVISSSVSGILNSLTPLFALVFGVLLFNIKLKIHQLIGILIGMAGTIIVILYTSNEGAVFSIGYSLLVVLATVFYGLNANIIKSKLQDIKPIQVTMLTFTFLGPIALTYVFSTDFLAIMQTNATAWNSFYAICILGSIGTSYALIFFVYLAHRTSAVFASMVTYIIPAVAMIIGFFTGEKIGMLHIVGLICILLGVYFSSLKK